MLWNDQHNCRLRSPVVMITLRLRGPVVMTTLRLRSPVVMTTRNDFMTTQKVVMTPRSPVRVWYLGTLVPNIILGEIR
jgi:hypothetical protein